jgi:poly-gamma-glutamate synthesis protein (capsule biosynthesis protein)
MRLPLRRSTSDSSQPSPERQRLPSAAAFLEQPPLEFVRLVFLGDIAAGRGRAAPVLDPAIAGIVQSADLVIANCDTPIVQRPYRPVRSWLGYHRYMDAGTLLGIIAALGVETERLVLSLANDRVFDQSRSGFAETVATLASLQVRTLGRAGQQCMQTVKVGSLTIGFVAFSQDRPRAARAASIYATTGMPDAAWFATHGEKPDIICATPHWGSKASRQPADLQTATAEFLARQGVRLAVGHRGRRLMPIEQVAGCCVAYGIGRFHTADASRRSIDRIGGLLVVDISTVPWEHGQVAAYEMVPFMRMAERHRDRIVPLEALPASVRELAEAEIASAFPARG